MKNTATEADIVDWFVNNGAQINDVLRDMNNAKTKLMEMEPTVFHEDIIKEFNELGLQKIANLITKDLAIPVEMVYNIIEDKKLVMNALNRNLN